MDCSNSNYIHVKIDNMENLEEIQPESRPMPQTALLSYTQYTLLNEAISKAKGYPKNGTSRIWSMYPDLAKVNQTFDTEGNETSFDIVCALKVSGSMLEEYPQYFEGLELVNDWDVIPYDGELDLLELDGLTTETIDWFLENVNDQFVFQDGMIITIGDRQPSTLNVVKELTDKGLLIGIYDEEN